MKRSVDKFRLLFLCISGLLTGITVVFPKVGYFEWITIVPAAMALISIAEDRDIKPFKAYLYGGAFFMPFYLTIYHWFLAMYPLDFIDVSHAVALLIVLVAWIGLAIIQTLTGSLIFLVFTLIARCRIFERFRVLFPFLAGALWACIEWSQTIGWWGVPWGRLALGQTETSLMLLSASLFGSYFVTFLIVAVNFSIAYLLYHQELARVMATASICMVVGNLILGGAVRLLYSNEGNESITVAAVQGNIHLNEKWSDGRQDQITLAHTKYTLEAADEGAELIIWAETAFPYDLDDNLAQYFSNLAIDADATLIASSFTYPYEPVYGDSGELRSLNSLMEVRADGSFGNEIYSKQRLVPFAEFVPMKEFISTVIPPLAELNRISDDVLPGEESVVLHTERGNVGCMICFDSVYENIAREAVQGGAQMLIVSTNDAWFETSAENYMHTSQSKLRAIETGRYLVRAANTGISGIINPLGEFEQRLGILEEGIVIGDIYLRDSTTLYTLIGNTFAYVCVGLCSGALAVSVFIYIKDNRRRRI